jgi:hypothetical protein
MPNGGLVTGVVERAGDMPGEAYFIFNYKDMHADLVTCSPATNWRSTFFTPRLRWATCEKLQACYFSFPAYSQSCRLPSRPAEDQVRQPGANEPELDFQGRLCRWRATENDRC